MARKKPFVEGWGKYTAWSIFMLVLTATYVICELMFNAALLDSASGYVQDEVTLDQVQIIGKCLASFGFSLFIYGLLSKGGRLSYSIWRDIRRLVLTIAIAGPVFYGIIEGAIDYIGFEHTTPEQRWASQNADLLRRVEGAGLADIYGMRLKKGEDPLDADRMVYHTISGAVMLADLQHVTNSVKNGTDAYVKEYIRLVTNKNADESYRKYQEFEPELRAAWTAYKEANQQYIDRSKISDKDFNNLWSSLLSDAQRMLPEANKRTAKDRKKAVKQIYLVASRINDTLNRARQNRGILGYGGKGAELLTNQSLIQDWNYRLNPKGHYNYNPLSIACGGQVSLRCSPSQSTIRSRLWQAYNYDHYDVYGTGLGINTLTPTTLLATQRGAMYTKKAMGNKGIYLDASFVQQFRGNKNTLRNYVNVALVKKNEVEFQKEVNELLDVGKVFIRPNMKFQDFLFSLRDFIDEKTDGNFTGMLRLGMTKNEFKNEVLAALALSKVNTLSRRYSATKRDFEGNGLLSEGVEMFRGLIVPPISLGLSLFFSLVALVKLPGMINEVIYASSKGRVDFGILTKLILFAGICALVVAPFYYKEHQATPGEIKTLDIIRDVSPALEKATQWVYIVEPHLYEYGHQLLDRAGYNKLNPVNIYQ